MTAGSGGERR